MMVGMVGDSGGDHGHDNGGDSDPYNVCMSFPRLPNKAPANWEAKIGCQQGRAPSEASREGTVAGLCPGFR